MILNRKGMNPVELEFCVEKQKRVNINYLKLFES